MALTPPPRRVFAIKAGIFALGLIPVAKMAYLTLTQQLVQPLEHIPRGTGDWVL